MSSLKQLSKWRDATIEGRGLMFQTLDPSTQLQVAQNLSIVEGGKILDQMNSPKNWMQFLNCMGKDQVIPALANATEKTRQAFMNEIPPGLQEIMNPGIQDYFSHKAPISAQEMVKELKSPGPRYNGLKPTKIILYTDLGRDIDDAVLLIILAYLHKIGVIEILLVVANVKPSMRRAKAAKFIVEEMGASEVPIAYGTDGTDENITLHPYELKRIGEPKGAILNGDIATVETLRALENRGQHCSLIAVSSLRDLSKLIKEHESLVKNSVSSVFSQGAWEVGREVRTLIPDMTVVNNSYDCEATIHAYVWLRQNTIPTYTATRHAAFMAPVSAHVFQEATNNGNSVASYICYAFGEQERTFYDQANGDPEKRFKPHMGPEWFANRCRRWREAHGDKIPKSFEEIEPYLDMTLYDVVAGLICSLLQYGFVEKIYQPHQQSILIGENKVNHYIIGRQLKDCKKVEPDINPELFSDIVVELLREGMLESKQIGNGGTS